MKIFFLVLLQFTTFFINQKCFAGGTANAGDGDPPYDYDMNFSELDLFYENVPTQINVLTGGVAEILAALNQVKEKVDQNYDDLCGYLKVQSGKKARFKVQGHYGGFEITLKFAFEYSNRKLLLTQLEVFAPEKIAIALLGTENGEMISSGISLNQKADVCRKETNVRVTFHFDSRIGANGKPILDGDFYDDNLKRGGLNLIRLAVEVMKKSESAHH